VRSSRALLLESFSLTDAGSLGESACLDTDSATPCDVASALRPGVRVCAALWYVCGSTGGGSGGGAFEAQQHQQCS
jgi:hypothetical protein